MPQVKQNIAASHVQQIVHDYIGTKSWFYQSQIDPYLPELSTHVLNELAKRGMFIATADKPAPKKMGAKRTIAKKPAAKKPATKRKATKK